jgi:phosphatidylinositol 3-kinase
MKVQQKFSLESSDEDASQRFQFLINESVSAVAPQVIDKIHQWARE